MPLVEAARALSEVLAVPELEARAMAGIEQALPWVTWLAPDDRLEFASSFVRTVRACHDTGNYEPLTRLLGRWKASAQMAMTRSWSLRSMRIAVPTRSCAWFGSWGDVAEGR